MTDIWGITEDGYYRPTQQEILADRRAKLRAAVDPDLDLGDETVLGQIIGVDSKPEALLWELGETIHHMMDPDSAEGEAFENLAKLSSCLKVLSSYCFVFLL